MTTKQINFLVDFTKIMMIVSITVLIVTLIILCVSNEPANALYSFFIGPFLSIRRIGNIIGGAGPLIFTALAVMIIFRAGQFSMISEGAFFMGAAVAMATSISFTLPTGLHLIVCIACSALAGLFVAAIPAVLKKVWSVSEVVTSIMLNYVVQYFAIYLVTYHYREKTSSSVVSLKLQETSLIPTLIPKTVVHWGIVIGLIMCVLCWFLIYRSKFGYKLRITGANPIFAHYSGIKETWVMLGAQLIAGAIAGMGGSVELLGMYTRFKWTDTPGYGWTGIVVALLAKDNPLLVPLSACFIAYINTGASVMAMNSDVSSEMAQVIQGIIMLLIASQALLSGFRQHLIAKSALKDAATVEV